MRAAPGPRARARGGGGRTSATGRPAKDLGQNFLRDPNILAVIGREGELRPDDVVLEVGGGEGVLSAYLAPRVGWVHVVEIDERLRSTLEASVAGFQNVTLWWGDAMRADLAAMEPAPTKTVANLPYGIAAGLLLRTIEELPRIALWVAMVQREVGERLAAAPGSGAYGVSSVLAQLAGEVRVVRTVPRTVFRPVPNVDSALVKIVRRGPAAPPGVRRLVGAAFAHRRKTLAGALALSGIAVGKPAGGIAVGKPAGGIAVGKPAGGIAVGKPAGGIAVGKSAGGGTRARAREALAELGLPEDVRAERLSPQQFVALADKLGVS